MSQFAMRVVFSRGRRGFPFRTGILLLLTAVFSGLLIPRLSAFTPEEIITRCRMYLAATDPTVRAQLAQEIGTYTGNIDVIVTALQPTAPKNFAVGYSGLQHFSLPELSQKYPDDQLYYYVPKSYNPDRPTGLLIALHGGGAGSSREAARGTVDPNSGALAYGYTLYIPNSSYIAVGPSAPWSMTNDARWNQADVDDYIAAVITESQNRFAIDPNRIVLTGMSMGGVGAYALGLRMADRFGAVQAFAGSWEKAFWKAAIGTPFHFLHGTYDSVPSGDLEFEARPHYTDVAYARLAERLMRTDYLMPSVYEEHPGTHTSGHPLEGPPLPGLERFFAWMPQQKRDPYQRHVVAATPADGEIDSPHNRWVSIDEVSAGNILFDRAAPIGDTWWGETYDQWLQWRLLSKKVEAPGAFVDATYEGNNVFRVSTRNVKKFSLWLHPKMMIDFSRPMTIRINDREVTHSAAPSLVTALRSYERRRDWGLIYHAEIALDATENGPSVGFATAASSASEESAQIDLPVVLSDPWPDPVVVNYRVAGGSATRGTDYVLADGSLVFPPGETNRTIPVTIVNDTVPEGDETVVVSLSGPANASLAPETTHALTITGARELGDVFTAYNDFAWTSGQLSQNITTYAQNQSGPLLNFVDGRSTGVILNVDDGAAGAFFWNRLYWEGHPSPGTDAFAVFNGKVDAHGYLDAGSKNLNLTFAGLNPNLRYEVVLYGNAGDPDWWARRSTVTLGDVASSENRSTPGSDFLGPVSPAASVPTGYNSIDGHVARFDGIDPGPDGDMTITLSHYYRGGYQLNALMLRAGRR